MKKIYFIRHAKAVDESEGSDFERDLSERGKKDLALMCERLKSMRLGWMRYFQAPPNAALKQLKS